MLALWQAASFYILNWLFTSLKKFWNSFSSYTEPYMFYSLETDYCIHFADLEEKLNNIPERGTELFIYSSVHHTVQSVVRNFWWNRNLGSHIRFLNRSRSRFLNWFVCRNRFPRLFNLVPTCSKRFSTVMFVKMWPNIAHLLTVE